MIWCRRIRDRRGIRRPSNGDREVCPRCGGWNLEFNDRYRIAGTNGVITSTPAWVCDGTGCGYCLPVRVTGRRNEPTPRPRMARASLRHPVRSKKSG